MSSSSKMNGHCARVLPAPVHNHPPLKERKKVTPTCPLPGRERKRFLTLKSHTCMCGKPHTSGGFSWPSACERIWEGGESIARRTEKQFFSRNSSCAVYYLTTGGEWTRRRKQLGSWSIIKKLIYIVRQVCLSFREKKHEMISIACLFFGKSTWVSIFPLILAGFCPCCALDSGHRKGERETKTERGEKEKKNKEDRKRERERECSRLIDSRRTGKRRQKSQLTSFWRIHPPFSPSCFILFLR